MYLARLDTDDGEWVQGTAVIRAPGARAPGAGDLWWDDLGRALTAAARIADGTVGRRITVDPEGRLEQLVSVTAPAVQERNVREAFASLTRLERRLGGGVSLPLSREEHDTDLERLPPLRFCTTEEKFGVGGIRVACDFRVGPVLDELLADACSAGYRLTYQLHLRSIVPDPEWLRAARKNVLALEALPGARQALAERQDEVARGLERAGALCEEYLAVDSAEAASAVAALLQDRFRAEFGRFGFTAPAFRFQAGAHDDAMILGVHSHDLEPLPPVELCGASVAAAERDRLLAWRPSGRLAALLAADAVERPAEREESETLPPLAEGLRLPEPYASSGPYAFVSYKRQDMPRIAPLLRQVVDCGVPVWFDRGIPGGAEWDAIIEERLAHCRFVLLFLSRAAVESKYVRREVKFADALDTPVLCILLEDGLDDVPLTHGMRMLLMQYQILDARAAEFPQRLRQAVERMA